MRGAERDVAAVHRLLASRYRLPVLVLDDGVSIPESETIVEYLEDAFPDPALRPHGAEAAARVRLIARVSELYVKGPLFALFGQLDPSKVRAQDVAIAAAVGGGSED